MKSILIGLRAPGVLKTGDIETEIEKLYITLEPSGKSSIISLKSIDYRNIK